MTRRESSALSRMNLNNINHMRERSELSRLLEVRR
jgi:hypothetical protein